MNANVLMQPLLDSYLPLYEALADTAVSAWVPELKTAVTNAYANNNHGDMPRWINAINNLPQITPSLQNKREKNILTQHERILLNIHASMLKEKYSATETNQSIQR